MFGIPDRGFCPLVSQIRLKNVAVKPIVCDLLPLAITVAPQGNHGAAVEVGHNGRSGGCSGSHMDK